jgi:hypothetical protein
MSALARGGMVDSCRAPLWCSWDDHWPSEQTTDFRAEN